jgi:hypothetical protein
VRRLVRIGGDSPQTPVNDDNLRSALIDNGRAPQAQ